MANSFGTFERLKDKGIAAYQRGDRAAAKAYLVQAAECMLDLAEKNDNPNARQQQEILARELIDLARACERGAPPRRAGAARNSESGDADARVDDWIVQERPTIRFDDIAGLDGVKEEIRLRMLYPLTHPELAKRYGISLGGGVLLYGPPGTGKTMMAKAIACEIDATFFVISPADVLSKWVGQAEQNVRALFDRAEAEDKSVIFLDEVEALLPKRRDDSQSSVMQRVVPQLLQELEGFDRKADRCLLFVGATNKPWLLDDAVMRPGRFDAKIYVPLPDAPARYRMLEMYLATRPLADDVDLGALCDRLDGYSGADIRYLAERAAARPFREAMDGSEPRAIMLADIDAVLATTPPSVSPRDLARYDAFAAVEAAD